MKVAKKLLKGLLITLAILVGIVLVLFLFLAYKGSKNPPRPIIEEGYFKSTVTSGELEKKYTAMGAFDVSEYVVSANDKAAKTYRIWYPTVLESGSRAFPLVVIANATASPAELYEPYFEHLASWGFVVAGDDCGGTGSGKSVEKLLAFCLCENENSKSVLYGKIDLDNIGISGASQGGPGALNAVNNFENGKYYKTIFTASTLNKGLAKLFRWDYDVSKIHIPYFLCAGTGDTDGSEKTGIAPLSLLNECFEALSDGVPKVMGRCVGAEHEDMLQASDGYMTAWMLYWLQGDEEAGTVFFGEDPEIARNVGWQDVRIYSFTPFFYNTR